MNIIFSPAKEMNLDNKLNEDWSLSQKSQKIVEVLQSMSKNDLQKKLGINDSVLSQVIEYISGFDKQKSYKALDLYHGLAYRWMKNVGLVEEDLAYLDQHFTILSALYGPIKSSNLIKPYRLDFNTSIKLDGQSLKAYWKAYYNDFFMDDSTIINLASDEFSSLLDRNRFNIIDVEFFENNKDKLKKHSTISKKGRGQMLAYMAKNKVKRVEELKAFSMEGYQFSEELSDEHKFVFLK